MATAIHAGLMDRKALFILLPYPAPIRSYGLLTVKMDANEC